MTSAIPSSIPETDLIGVRCVPCIVCGERHIVVLTVPQARAIEEMAKNGGLIQHAVPDLPAEQRETLMSGIGPICQTELFG